MCTIIILKILQIFGMFNMRYAEGVKEKNEMVVNIKQEIAQQIVEAVKDVCLHDINFIDAKGKIFASTNPRRIGEFHEVGRQVILSGKTIEVFARTRTGSAGALSENPVEPGYSFPSL